MELIRAHVLISGRVQRVGFRYSTQDMASVYGLSGWVRNLANGQVEAVFEGDRAAVEKMIHWCHAGPPHAHVEQVIVNYEQPAGIKHFEIERTQ